MHHALNPTRKTRNVGGWRNGPRHDGVPIATVSQTLDIPVPTIRSWERRYGFPSPPRTGGRHRRYTTQEIEQLRDLRDLITRGRPAREAAARLSAASTRVVDGELLEAVIDAAMHLDSDGVRSALDRSAERLGIEGAIRDVVFPAMQEIGTRWKTGACDVEQEHLATESVRAWLARQAAMAPPPFRADPIVLACGPKDLHTIGLEAFAVVLARRGWSLRCARRDHASDVAARDRPRRAGRGRGRHGAAERHPPSGDRGARGRRRGPGRQDLLRGRRIRRVPSARRDVPGTYLGGDVVLAAEVLEDVLGGLGRRGRGAVRR